MKGRIAKITSLVLLSIIAMGVIVGAAFFWRLSQGPVSLNFMGDRIEKAINRQMQGLTVSLGGAILELDQQSRIPRVRFRDLVLIDQDKNVIARAARAAVDLDSGALLQGSIVARSLELIGPKVSARRKLDGSFELGISSAPNATDQDVLIDDLAGDASSGKSDISGDGLVEPADSATTTSGNKLIELLAGGDTGSSMSTLEDIRITQAAVNIYDESNDANWFAPTADMTFRRMPYGFVLFAKAAVASGGDPWQTELSATYRRSTKSFSISTRIDGLVPANVADEIFALSHLARMNIPLSGHAEIETNDRGEVTQATAEFTAAAGVLSLPDYIAQPIIVDEGSLRLQYDAATGGFKIIDSSILVGGSRAELVGTVAPMRDDEGKLSAIAIDMKARNVTVDAQGTVRDPVRIDRIEFVGKAAIEEAKLDIDDLVIMSGNAGVRMRGTITGGDESAGLLLAGRLRDVSAELLKKLWPPIVAPKSRLWVSSNIISGRIADGTFSVNLPVNELAQGVRNKVLADEAIDFKFNFADVSSRYFRSLPPLQDASGQAQLRGNHFDLAIDKGELTLENGKHVSLNKGSFAAKDLLQPVVPGVFSFDVDGSVQALLDFADLPDLDLVKFDMTGLPKLGGNANAVIGLSMPLIKDVPREQVVVTSKIKVTDAAVSDVVPNIDLTDGNFTVDISKTGLVIEGPAKINGTAAKVRWEKPAGEKSLASATVETTLDDKGRAKLNLRTAEFMSGPVPVKAVFDKLGGKDAGFSIEADLSDVSLKLKSMNYLRAPTAKTQATFTVKPTADGGQMLNDLVVKGPNLSLIGDVELAEGGALRVVNLSEVRLDDETAFGVRVEPRDGGYDVTITGKKFDARPYIKALTTPNKPGATPATKSANKAKLTINAQFDRVYGHRGEIVENVSATIDSVGSTVVRADINGKFLSGLPVSVRMIPTDAGREVRVVSTDGGAVLRAADLYSKVAGGQLEFVASLNNDAAGALQGGRLNLRSFDVRNEAALAELDQKGKAKKSGPRKGGLSFTRLTLPFTADGKFIRIGDTLIKGNDLGATAQGVIRKADGAMDITGTIIPAYGLNSALGDIPLFGDILTGGNNEGVFGITFAMSGTMAKPNFQMNPVSALAPGILRKFFEYGNTGKPSKPPKVSNK